MPAYNSKFNDKAVEEVCGMAVLPLKTKLKGPMPIQHSDDEDIVDEAIKLFRANVMMAAFQVKGSADRVTIFLTLFISQCLKRLEKANNSMQAEKIMFDLAHEKFPVPGDKGWLLGGHIPSPKTRKEDEALKAYLSVLREETTLRLVPKVFPDGKPNKFFLAFAKKKFMNIHIV
uniref:Actin-related protein 2/3 complex subunit 3 n=1 Tax=Aplanochytrium stocchinoi TaxID=215587 RepID=A0A7S3LJT9_9STRA|mmetsp:Transcript_10530/g.13204  ORF Transcript_10530/g.13204 Transcript_10530/m.13204 type:complete len:174 (+) Transcript_10530:329-850(+)|eukprot:CAMPEP_0204839918 /NCGR_PEP_ID=MMETSP1346-20131115/35807_1 /ASSEMBLY_ACC=CAM_ASM_000771 /TAXON_ID=215587 /ORGANISM="Aplanochytrium stocchinoi, Strain GSBS06" /LENGTH=173 /DNA_ID=CAMNT_0051976987 /DNA_START=233 /DNA_END=754 /DNA_ORIENTATION=+